MEVLAEEQEVLDVQLAVAQRGETLQLLPLLHVYSLVVAVYVA